MNTANNLSALDHSPLSRSSSCSSATRRGLSSLAMRRQPSAMSDSTDRHFSGGINAFMTNGTLTEHPQQEELNQHYYEESTTTVQQVHRESITHCPSTDTTTSSSTHNHSSSLDSGEQRAHSNIATITDYSPDWAYVEGGIKVLITGPWYGQSNNYACLFDTTVVPATLVQPGVLKCICPRKLTSLTFDNIQEHNTIQHTDAALCCCR